MNINKKVAVAAGCVGSFLAGSASTYVFLSRKYDQDIAGLGAQIDEIRREREAERQLTIPFDRNEVQLIGEPESLIDTIAVANPSAVVPKTLGSVLEEPEETLIEISPDEDGEEQLVNIFRNEESDWDWATENTSRKNKLIYIVSREEYDENDGELSQDQLTWYNGDDILCDAQDKPLYNWQEIVGGEENLRFGHGSNDQSIVYVRNEVLGSLYEVILDNGFYMVEVLGHEIEDQHEKSDNKLAHSLHKFRGD